MSILLDGKTLKAPLPDMATAAVVPMIAPDMAGHPALHEGTQGISGRGLQHEMKVIRHQTKAQDMDRKLFLRRGQQIEKRQVVGIFVKNDASAVPTVEDMIGVAGELTARNPRHDVERYENRARDDKGKVACPPFPARMVLDGQRTDLYIRYAYH